MPSWSASNAPRKKTTPSAAGATQAIERARRLLEQFLAGHGQNDPQPPSKR